MTAVRGWLVWVRDLRGGVVCEKIDAGILDGMTLTTKKAYDARVVARRALSEVEWGLSLAELVVKYPAPKGLC